MNPQKQSAAIEPTASTGGPQNAATATSTTVHAVGPLTVVPTIIPVNASTAVAVSVAITDPAVDPASVSLLQPGATGTQPTVLGQLRADGNGLYGTQITLNPRTTGQVRLEVSAAFEGQSERAMSPIAQVGVWNSFSDRNTGLSFWFPPLSTTTTIFSAPGTATSAATLDVSEFDPAISDFVAVLGMTAEPNPARLTLQQWFEQNVDDASGTLLDSGAFVEKTLAHGATALVSNNPIPDQYQGGPVSEAYIMSPSADRILMIDVPQNSALGDFVTSPYQTIGPAEEQIFQSMTFK
ncbi:MAG TPA: hypothetical protein VMT99_01405 [Candidatus Paceibacterota bacterium]|nr:hypothetical protein [Candidatus Paceibacterota bacterium]